MGCVSQEADGCPTWREHSHAVPRTGRRQEGKETGVEGPLGDGRGAMAVSGGNHSGVVTGRCEGGGV